MKRVLRLMLLLTLAVFAAQPLQAAKRVALTFDDVPRNRGAFFTPDERTTRLISALKLAKVRQAAFFLNPGRLSSPDGEGGEERIAAYAAAGHVIANHSFSHPRLSASAAEDYLADIDKADTWLKGRTGERRWFRFPYLDEGGSDKAKRDAIRAGLATRGLRNGYVTADGNDYFLEELTIKAAKDGKALDMKQLRRLYIGMQLSAVEYHDELARRTLGRSPAHVLLLHETDLAAMFLTELVAELRHHGWSIVTCDEAYRDRLRDAFPDVPYAYGTLVGSLAWERSIDPPTWPVWIGSTAAEAIFNQRVIKKAAAQ